MFAHERLQVYGRALEFAGTAAGWTNVWDKRHALVDHLTRAAESIVSNLAEAARQRGAPARLRDTDYAIGSSLECAGCLDLAQIKGLLTETESCQEKDRLCEVTRMLIGLRKAWISSIVREDSTPYTTARATAPGSKSFHHERLEVYQAALAFMGWFVSHAGPEALTHRLLRRIDEAATSVVLNIAEGNGRYSELDHRRFLEIADSGAVKAAVCIDLCVQAGVWDRMEAASGKNKLRRISALLAGF